MSYVAKLVWQILTWIIKQKSSNECEKWYVQNDDRGTVKYMNIYMYIYIYVLEYKVHENLIQQ